MKAKMTHKHEQSQLFSLRDNENVRLNFKCHNGILVTMSVVVAFFVFLPFVGSNGCAFQQFARVIKDELYFQYLHKYIHLYTDIVFL